MNRFPACAGEYETEMVDVWAMMHGKTGKCLWVDLASLPWLVTYAAHEFVRLGVPGSPKLWKQHDLKVLDKQCEGFWGYFKKRELRWQSWFVKPTGNVKSDVLNQRRYFPRQQLDAPLYNKFASPELLQQRTFAQAYGLDKAVACQYLCIAWAHAVPEGRESAFLSDHGLSLTMMRAPLKRGRPCKAADTALAGNY